MAEHTLLATGLDAQSEHSEAALIERIRKGEKELFYGLIQPYERSVYLTILSVLRNHSDAEEVAQEALLKAFTHSDQLRSTEKFKAWLLLIAVNEARMRKRKDRRHLYESMEEPLRVALVATCSAR
jgi:RNA polymerase sigma-70 factor (ECF subfamily)